MHALSYPYAYYICGTPVSQTHDDSSYTLTYKVKKCAGRNTEIYLNENLYFPDGFDVSFSPSCAKCFLRSVDKKNYYEVVVDDKAIFSTLQVRVAGPIR